MATTDAVQIEEIRVSFHEMLDLLLEVEQTSDAFNQEVMESVRDTVRSKLYSYKRFLDFCKADIQLCKDEIDRLRRRSEAIENAAKRLRQLIAYNMDVRGIKTLKAGTCTFTLFPGKESLVIDNPDDVPEAFKFEVVQVQINNGELKRALEIASKEEDGPKIPGARLVFGVPYIQVR